MATHMAGVWGTAKAKLYGMGWRLFNQDTTRRLGRLAKYMLQQPGVYAGKNRVCTII